MDISKWKEAKICAVLQLVLLIQILDENVLIKFDSLVIKNYT